MKIVFSRLQTPKKGLESKLAKNFFQYTTKYMRCFLQKKLLKIQEFVRVQTSMQKSRRQC